MIDLVQTIVHWRVPVMVLLVFGFAPHAILRVLVHAFPRDCARRNELLAEFRFVKRIERPIWVVEQFETALFDGLPARFHEVRARRALRLVVQLRIRLSGVKDCAVQLVLARDAWGDTDRRTTHAFRGLRKAARRLPVDRTKALRSRLISLSGSMDTETRALISRTIDEVVESQILLNEFVCERTLSLRTSDVREAPWRRT